MKELMNEGRATATMKSETKLLKRYLKEKYYHSQPVAVKRLYQSPTHKYVVKVNNFADEFEGEDYTPEWVAYEMDKHPFATLNFTETINALPDVFTEKEMKTILAEAENILSPHTMIAFSPYMSGFTHIVLVFGHGYREPLAPAAVSSKSSGNPLDFLK